MLVKVTMRLLQWSCISREVKFHRVFPTSARHGDPKMTSMSSLMESRKASIWNVLVWMRSGMVKQDPRQASLVSLPTSTVVVMRRSARPMMQAMLESMTLWVAPMSTRI
jgi:hypothetical protein